MDADGERRGLRQYAPLSRSASGPPQAQQFFTKVFGTKNAPTQRVSESLDYEPVQNAIFYKRMKAAKEHKNLFG